MNNTAEYINNMLGMAKHPDKFFNLVLADVPYGIGEGKKAETRSEFVKQKSGSTLYLPNRHKSKEWDDKQPEQSYFDEIFRVGKKHIIFGENYIQFSQKDSSSGRIFWDKVNGTNDFSDGELLWTNLFSSVRQIEFMWNGFMQATSIHDGRAPNGNKKKNQIRIHPTEKPIQLYKWFFMNYAQPGWKILDTNLGSGASRIAAYDMDFPFWSFENDKEYFDAQEERFQNHIKQERIVFE